MNEPPRLEIFCNSARSSAADVTCVLEPLPPDAMAEPPAPGVVATTGVEAESGSDAMLWRRCANACRNEARATSALEFDGTPSGSSRVTDAAAPVDPVDAAELLDEDEGVVGT